MSSSHDNDAPDVDRPATAGARRPTRERVGLLRWTGYPHQTGRGRHALDDRGVRMRRRRAVGRWRLEEHAGC